MHSVSRRGFLVLGGTGAAGAALASCGGKTSERTESDDGALLGAALAAEQALEQAYGSGTVSGGNAARQRATIATFRAASAKRVAELEGLGAAAGGDAGDASASGNLIDAANAAISAYRAAAGPLSNEQDRGTMIAFLAAVAAELVVLKQLDDEQPVPYAFVTGEQAAPNVAANEPAPSDEETTSTEESTTSTETTTGDGQ